MAEPKKYVKASVNEFKRVLDDYVIKDKIAFERFKQQPILQKCNPNHTRGFLEQYRIFHEYLLAEVDRYNKNSEISEKNLRLEPVEFNWTPFVIWERAHTRLFQLFLADQARLDDECTVATKSVNAIREILRTLNLKGVIGMATVRYPEIEMEDDLSLNEHERKYFYHMENQIHDMKKQTEKLLFYTKNNPEKQKYLEEKEKFMIQKYVDEIYFWQLPILYTELEKSYEYKYKKMVRPPQQLIILPPIPRPHQAPRSIPHITSENPQKRTIPMSIKELCAPLMLTQPPRRLAPPQGLPRAARLPLLAVDPMAQPLKTLGNLSSNSSSESVTSSPESVAEEEDAPEAMDVDEMYSEGGISESEASYEDAPTEPFEGFETPDDMPLKNSEAHISMDSEYSTQSSVDFDAPPTPLEDVARQDRQTPESESTLSSEGRESKESESRRSSQEPEATLYAPKASLAPEPSKNLDVSNESSEFSRTSEEPESPSHVIRTPESGSQRASEEREAVPVIPEVNPSPESSHVSGRRSEEPGSSAVPIAAAEGDSSPESPFVIKRLSESSPFAPQSPSSIRPLSQCSLFAPRSESPQDRTPEPPNMSRRWSSDGSETRDISRSWSSEEPETRNISRSWSDSPGSPNVSRRSSKSTTRSSGGHDSESPRDLIQTPESGSGILFEEPEAEAIPYPESPNVIRKSSESTARSSEEKKPSPHGAVPESPKTSEEVAPESPNVSRNSSVSPKSESRQNSEKPMDESDDDDTKNSDDDVTYEAPSASIAPESPSSLDSEGTAPGVAPESSDEPPLASPTGSQDSQRSNDASEGTPVDTSQKSESTENTAPEVNQATESPDVSSRSSESGHSSEEPEAPSTSSESPAQESSNCQRQTPESGLTQSSEGRETSQNRKSEDRSSASKSPESPNVSRRSSKEPESSEPLTTVPEVNSSSGYHYVSSKSPEATEPEPDSPEVSSSESQDSFVGPSPSESQENMFRQMFGRTETDPEPSNVSTKSSEEQESSEVQNTAPESPIASRRSSEEPEVAAESSNIRIPTPESYHSSDESLIARSPIRREADIASDISDRPLSPEADVFNDSDDDSEGEKPNSPKADIFEDSDDNDSYAPEESEDITIKSEIENVKKEVVDEEEEDTDYDGDEEEEGEEEDIPVQNAPEGSEKLLGDDGDKEKKRESEDVIKDDDGDVEGPSGSQKIPSPQSNVSSQRKRHEDATDDDDDVPTEAKKTRLDEPDIF